MNNAYKQLAQKAAVHAMARMQDDVDAAIQAVLNDDPVLADAYNLQPSYVRKLTVRYISNLIMSRNKNS